MSFEETIIHCSAPALCGIKPANLFSMDASSFFEGRKLLLKWQGDFCKSKRYFVPLKKDDSRFLFFVYDRELVEEVISRPENIPYLESKGYSFSKGINGILCELLHRLMYQNNFPHEVGLFLGYPLEDVIGFERDRSAYKYSGFWKVYGNKDKAEEKMKLYKSCSEICMKWLDQGLSVPGVARKYSNHIEKKGA
ncbi:MAG: DUF3793 family protein [Treponema sp.]|nr:DUF3793 family protein [Treponema sp.]